MKLYNKDLKFMEMNNKCEKKKIIIELNIIFFKNNLISLNIYKKGNFF